MGSTPLCFHRKRQGGLRLAPCLSPAWTLLWRSHHCDDNRQDEQPERRQDAALVGDDLAVAHPVFPRAHTRLAHVDLGNRAEDEDEREVEDEFPIFHDRSPSGADCRERLLRAESNRCPAIM